LFGFHAASDGSQAKPIAKTPFPALADTFSQKLPLVVSASLCFNSHGQKI